MKDLSTAILKANREKNFSSDFNFDQKHFYGQYDVRQKEQGKFYYESLGVMRDDKEARQKAVELNYPFFGAPHAAFLFMPAIGDNVRLAVDRGMYAQSFLLSLASRGIGSIPQTSLGFFADTIREKLGISNEFKMLFSISFGHPDFNHASSRNKIARVPLAESVTFYN